MGPHLLRYALGPILGLWTIRPFFASRAHAQVQDLILLAMQGSKVP